VAEQETREAVIKEFKDNYRRYSPGYAHVLVRNWAIRDAIDLLEAQKPRVMTWDELIATDHVYIETNKDGQKYIVPGIVTIVRDTAVIASVRIGTRLIDGTIDKDVYGIECRCWTSRPTDTQREATPWRST